MQYLVFKYLFYIYFYFIYKSHHGHMVTDIQLPVPSMPITTTVVSLSPNHGDVCPTQYYVIKFGSDLRQVGGFPRVLRFLHQ